MHIIFGNFGNHTIALMQWAYEHKLENVYVISVDTNFADEHWNLRVELAEKFAKFCGFNPIRLKAKPSFQDLVHDRNQFPSQKFQWCAGFLKGLPLLEWLDENDKSRSAIIMMGKRRLDAKIHRDLPEYIEVSEHHGSRKVWYPLYACDNDEFYALIQRAGFEILNHRSLECDPCIHSKITDFKRLSESSIVRVEKLEDELHLAMFQDRIRDVVSNAKSKPDDKNQQLYLGCGSPFACGE